MRPLLVALAALGLTALVGCPGTLEDPERFDNTPDALASSLDSTQVTTCDAPAILKAKCASCHSGATPIGSLSLAQPDALRGVAAKGGGGLLIDPAAPDKSVIYLKLLAPAPFGSVMPLNAPLSAKDIECVRSWTKSFASP